MKPERIQTTSTRAVTALKPDRGVYQTFQFDSRAKAENFADFVEDMADNHGQEVSCLTESRTYDVTLLVEDPVAAGEVAAQAGGAWKFLLKVAGIHREWSTPTEES